MVSKLGIWRFFEKILLIDCLVVCALKCTLFSCDPYGLDPTFTSVMLSIFNINK